jgi:hypothetical protein
MNQAVPVGTRPTRRKGRRVLLVLGSVAALGIAGVVAFVWLTSRELESLTAEMDRLDPGWRLEEIEANRRIVPDAQNSALHILKIKTLHGGQSVSTPVWETLLAGLPPQVQLNDQQVAYLDKSLAQLQKAVVEARKLKDMPYGRYPITYSAGFFTTILSCQEGRVVFDLLQWDAARRGHAGDADGALESCLALQHAACAIGDEPFLISQLVRYAGNAIAIAALERALAQGYFTQASEPSLERLQAGLIKEAAEPTLLIALRGERAGAHELFEAVAHGKMSAQSLSAFSGGGPVYALSHVPGFLTSQHAALLRFHNRLVEAAKLPAGEQDERLELLDKKIRDEPLLVRMVAPAVQRVGEAERRTRANLLCAAAAVAAERFRVRHQHWPGSLEELMKAGLLDKAPVDPYDSQPIRFKRTADGVVIYSVGRDKIDNGGLIDRDRPLEPGTDLGFRLWDIARRRAAPNPPVPEEELPK